MFWPCPGCLTSSSSEEQLGMWPVARISSAQLPHLPIFITFGFELSWSWPQELLLPALLL